MFNAVTFQGNLVRAPEFAQTRGDTDIVNFTIASTRKYKQKEDTAFVDCTAYGMTATNVAKFFDKGDPIGVQGRLSQNVWQDQAGNKRSKIYITVDAFHFVGQTGNSGGGGGRGNSRGQGQGNGGQNNGGDNRGGGRGNNQGGGQNRQNNNNQNHQGGNGGNQQQGGQQAYSDDIPF